MPEITSKDKMVLIPYYPRYSICNDGRVYSWSSQRFLKPGYANGYAHVSLSRNGKSRTVTIHRLVAENFIANPDHLPTVNHVDGDKNNNNSVNLEWATQGDNNSHARRTGLSHTFKEGHYKAKLTMNKVANIRHLSRSGYAAHYLGKLYGVTASNIRAIITKRSWKEEVL